MATKNANNNHAARLASFDESAVPTQAPPSSRGSPLSFFFGRSRASTAATMNNVQTMSRPRSSTRNSTFSFLSTSRPDYEVSDTATLEEYMQKSYIPETSELRLDVVGEDPHYAGALSRPDKFADLLINVANLDKIKGSDGQRLLDDTMIERIRRMMVPELVINAVKRRKATYLLGLAQSPCTKEWLKSTERTLKQYSDTLTDPRADEDDRAHIGPLMSTFLLNIATLLLDGIDIANWDNFAWDIPANILSRRGHAESEPVAIGMIRNMNLRPTNVKNSEVARGRFPQCGDYFRAHTAAAAEFQGVKEKGVLVGGKTRKARKARKARKEKKTRYRNKY